MIDFERVKEDAVDRWDGIYAALGIEVGDGRHTSCPVCGGKDRFRMDNKGGNGTWFCSQCDPHSGDGWGLLMKVLGVDFKEAVEQVAGIVGTVDMSRVPKSEPTMTPELMRKIFMESQPVKERDLVHRYLHSRGLSVVPECLRYAPQCYEPETKKPQNAMLAVFRQADGQAVTMHRTYLSSYGEKLTIEKPKKILPSLGKMTGGAVRLFEIGESEILAVTEGIETAIAVHENTGLPVWASLSTTLLEGFIPPSEIKHVAIFGDNDRNYAGQKSAMVLANRLSTVNKITVDVFIPPHPGDDWLDDMIRRKLPTLMRCLMGGKKPHKPAR